MDPAISFLCKLFLAVFAVSAVIKYYFFAIDIMKIIFDEMDLRSLEVIEIARQFLLFFDRCDNCDCEGCPECNFLGVVQVRNADGTEFG